MKCSVQDNANDGVESIGRQSFGARHEISGGVVDQRIDFAELFLGLGCRGFDGAVVAHVASRVGSCAARPVDLIARFFERFFPPADHEHARA